MFELACVPLVAATTYATPLLHDAAVRKAQRSAVDAAQGLAAAVCARELSELKGQNLKWKHVVLEKASKL